MVRITNQNEFAKVRNNANSKSESDSQFRKSVKDSLSVPLCFFTTSLGLKK